MPDTEPDEDTLRSSRARKVFKTTQIPLGLQLRIGAVLLVAVIGIGLTFLYMEGEPDGGAGVEAKRLTSEEQFIAVSKLPPDFAEKLPVEKIDILRSKIEAGEELVSSGDQYAEHASDQLVSLYGTLCQVQVLEGLSAFKTYERLAELREEAVAEGNEELAASANYHCAMAATSRLLEHTEQNDFSYAAHAVLRLESKNLVNIEQISDYYRYVIDLHNRSSKQDSTAIFLSVLGDKLIGSPVRDISLLGRNLKDYPRYARFYAAIVTQPYTTRESKLEFFRELFVEIEKAPPQSPETYRIVFLLIDRLINKSEGHLAGTLVKRLGKAASMADPTLKANIDAAIQNIETRISSLGKAVDLSGSDFTGEQLQLPNDKPTLLLFWRKDVQKSIQHIKTIASSERFNPWGTNVLVVCISPQPAEVLAAVAEGIGKFTVLDNATSSRLVSTFAIDLVPYQVSLDKDGQVIRLGSPTD